MTYSLTPGIIDEPVKRAFTFGACGGLAISIHNKMGWPLIKVTDLDAVYSADDAFYDEDTSDEERCDLSNKTGDGAGGLHWMVLHPSGLLLDIDGLHEPADVIAEYDDEADDGMCGLGRASLEDAVDEYVQAKGEPVSLMLCDTLVVPLLDSLK